MSEETDDPDVPNTPDAEATESDTELRTDGGETAAANPSGSGPSTETGPTAPAGPTGPARDNPSTESVDQNQSSQSNASFETICTRLLGGHRVIVESAKGHRFEGVLDQFDLEERHVLLTDAQESPSGASYDRVFVAEVDWIVLAGRHE